MPYTWILLLLLVSGGGTFMIHNSKLSLCVEDSAGSSEVLLKKCNLDSEFQRWAWVGQGMLMCVASSRCLSAQQSESVHTQPCSEPDVNPAGLLWDCDSGRLFSRNASMLLSTDGQRLILTKHSKHAKWGSLDEGDICQDRLRLRRSSSDPFGEEEELVEEMATMTDEQREYLLWFYRTEDPTMWTFVLLGLAFICLLIGFLLLGMGTVANKSRKKIAKYKAAASLVKRGEGEELLVVPPLQDNGTSLLLQEHKYPNIEGDASTLTAGNIVVTWKNGDTSCLYSDPPAEETQEEEKQEEVPDVEQEACDEVKTTA
ncbi:solute carrier family 51 subunit beta [Kryptolebias marmoratus]|uniref:solute carrier family 51 subunit beta n=1 Tax=Kryptolebias marmoratus TaxID=37003 RepID=UPI0007F88ECC|nr:solute carrier family 51 subunit beta [Kryptolebias marmoratus]